MKLTLFVLSLISILTIISVNQEDTLADKISEGIVKMRGKQVNIAFAHSNNKEDNWQLLTVKEHILELRNKHHLCPQSSRFLSAAFSTYDDELASEKINRTITSQALSMCK